MRILLLFLAALCSAQVNPDWTKAIPGIHIVGNVYYVGTYDLACYLIVTPQGDILINTGVADSVATIRQSIESLGFRLQDVKILLTMQAHYDHVAGMAEMKKVTGAKLLATDGDAGELEDGGKSDYVLSGPTYQYKPVKVDGRIKDGQQISLGGTELTAYVHPGHTRGSVSYGLTIVESGKTYHVLIANMGSINPGTILIGNPKYPTAAADYEQTFREQKKLSCDIFLSAHASQFRLHEKWHPGQPYDPNTFVDPEGYKAAVKNAEAAYKEYLAKEKATR